MPSDLVSREAVLDEVRGLFDNHGKWTSWATIHEAIANLPAAGDERWEKEIRTLIADYRTTLKQGVLESDTGEDMLHHATEDLERIRDRLSPPQQEANPHE